MEYAKKALGDLASDEEESQTDTNRNLDSGPVERKKQAKKGKKAKVDAVSMVSHIGKAWIGDIKDASLDVIKHMVRGFITFHYRRASRVKDGVVPWMQISTQRSDYISGKYLPQGAKLREPSKLQKKEDPVEVDSDKERVSRRRTAAKGKRKAAPNHWPTDIEESEDDQGGLTDEEEPGDVCQEPGARSKHVDMGKQARGRGLDNEGIEEEEADGQRRTQSEAVCNPKDSGMHQARNKVRERDSDGKYGRAKAR
ncbi:hypothetical protein PAXRUDRAFT_22484 [Paxillus rubicundulus Ve08.2h10]|uniref:Uncharacterized protein n=1 Tax=Paxillus rubicundulus Ve08.2h10 TaxID=930991 RepID=A0A0D0BK31_9AGAM|nr:hypothetical protein PAXRUDRAFT_22484 [Paxillus rubicundulus Ve08.2h10]